MTGRRQAVKGLIPGSNGGRTWLWVCKAVQSWSVQGPWSTTSVGVGVGAQTPDY